MSVRQLRLVVAAEDYVTAVAFYRDVLGLAEREAAAVAPRLRVAFKVDDVRAVPTTGAVEVAPPTVTPWNSLNSRLDAPGGLQITLFQELSDPPPDAFAVFGAQDSGCLLSAFAGVLKIQRCCWGCRPRAPGPGRGVRRLGRWARRGPERPVPVRSTRGSGSRWGLPVAPRPP
jgi:hypothetical protein